MLIQGIYRRKRKYFAPKTNFKVKIHQSFKGITTKPFPRQDFLSSHLFQGPQMLIQRLGWSADTIQGSAWPRHLVGQCQRWSRQARNKNLPHLFVTNIKENKQLVFMLLFPQSCLSIQLSSNFKTVREKL